MRTSHIIMQIRIGICESLTIQKSNIGAVGILNGLSITAAFRLLDLFVKLFRNSERFEPRPVQMLQRSISRFPDQAQPAKGRRWNLRFKPRIKAIKGSLSEPRIRYWLLNGQRCLMRRQKANTRLRIECGLRIASACDPACRASRLTWFSFKLKTAL